jgi:hypothetical protein
VIVTSVHCLSRQCYRLGVARLDTSSFPDAEEDRADRDTACRYFKAPARMGAKPRNFFRCDVCKPPEQFFVAQALMKHYRKVHAVEHGTFCVDCGRSFDGDAAWSRHLDEHYEWAKDKVTCVQCGKVVEAAGFDRHVERVHAQKK